MAEARKQDPVSDLRRIVVKRGPSPAREAGPAAEVTQVLVSKARFARIVGKSRPIGKVLSDYADTLAEAERTGRTASLTLRVSPDGRAERVSIDAANDPLETALAAARTRGDAKAADILRGEDMLTARDFGPLIGASHETVNAKRKRFEVLGLEGATRGVRYPRWQVTEAGLPLPGLAELFAVLGGQPWTVYRFLRTVHADLGGRTALDALKAGDLGAVIGTARNQAAGAFA